MKSLLSILALCVVASTASAAVIATYPFAGTRTGNTYDPTSTNTLLDPTSVDANVTASSISQAGAIAWRFQNANTNMSIYPGNTAVNSSTATGTAITTASDAVLNGSYFKFTITANSGFDLDLTSLTFDAAKGGSGTRGFAIQTSATGFSTDGSTNINASGAIAAGTFTSLSATYPTYASISIDLSGVTYQNLASLEVRIFSFSGSTSSSLEYDNFTVNGTVPEPSTFASLAIVCGIGFVGFFCRRMRSC